MIVSGVTFAVIGQQQLVAEIFSAVRALTRQVELDASIDLATPLFYLNLCNKSSHVARATDEHADRAILRNDSGSCVDELAATAFDHPLLVSHLTKICLHVL